MNAAPSAHPPLTLETHRGPLAAEVHAALVAGAQAGLSGALLVEHDDEIVLKAGYGWAHRERRTPFTPATIAQIGSLTKQFTAAAVADLASQGRLAFADPLAHHLPGVPAPAAGITLHHLLSHTAGLPESCGDDLERLTREALVQRCLGRLDRPPGAAFAYSNLGYSLLAAVVEVVTGRSFEAHLVARFFQPLGLPTIRYTYPAGLDSRLAFGYTPAGRRPPLSHRLRALAPDHWNLTGNGGLQASLDDMYAWYRALAHGSVLDAAARRALFTPHARRDDGAVYGYGWFLRHDAAGRLAQVSHTGSDGVFYAAFVWRPLDRLFFYLVTNTGEPTGAALASRVLRTLRAGAQ